MLAGREPKAEVYPHQIAFNVLPQVETFKDDDYTTEERKVMAETRKILGLGEEVGISATCARVPVITGHSESVNVADQGGPLPGGVPRAARRGARRRRPRPPRRRPLPAARPTPPAATTCWSAGSAATPAHERCLNLWIVGDNLRKGAATNAVQVAELLVERDLLGDRAGS